VKEDPDRHQDDRRNRHCDSNAVISFNFILAIITAKPILNFHVQSPPLRKGALDFKRAVK
jgi:hypothetical protein